MNSIDINDIDVYKLRNALRDYLGTAMTNLNMMQISSTLSNIDKESDENIIRLAFSYGFNLNNYKKNKIRTMHK